MAFPVVQGRAESSVTSAGTSHAVTLPTGIVSGDLVIIFFGHAVSCTLDALTGWTELVDTAAANAEKIIYRLCDGTEGTSVTFTSSASTKSAHVSYRISGAENPATQAPQLSTVATGTSTGPDPAIVTPTGGAKDYLWIAAFVMAGEEADDDTWCNNGPTSYTTLLQKTTAVAGVASTNCEVASAERTLNATSEDPATFNTDQSLAWRAWTIVVHPASSITYFQTLPAVELSVATLTRISTYLRTLAVILVSIPALIKGMFVSLSVVEVSIPTLTAALLFIKTLSATAVSVASLATAKVFSRTLSVVSTAISAMTRVFSRVVDPVLNFAKVELSQGYDSTVTTVVLATGDGAKLPNPSTDGAFNLVWHNSTDFPDPIDDPNREIVRVTDRSTDTLTIQRAQEGTTAATHNTVGKTYKMLLTLTKKTIDDIRNAL